MKPFEKDHSINDAIAALRKSNSSKVYISDIPRDGITPAADKKKYFAYLNKELAAKSRNTDLLLIVVQNPKL